MKIKTLSIPIYYGKLTLIYDKDLSYVEKKYKTTSLKDFGAVTLKDESKYRHYIIAFESDDLSIVAHEIIHVKNYIYSDCNMELDTNNDEPEAYLIGWLFTQCENFLKNNLELS